MSIPFNQNSSDSLGLVQLYELEIGVDLGHISGNTQRLRNFTAQANIAKDELFEHVFQFDGTWQLDDVNHTDWPDHTENLVSGTRRYAITADSDSNQIHEVFRAFVKDESGIYREIKRVDQQTEDDTQSFWDGQNNGGIPSRYDITGKWIDLDPVPNYNSTGGLKLFISRSPHYYTVSDTTATSGLPAFADSYLYLRPAEHYARRNQHANLGTIQLEIERIKQLLRQHYPRRTNALRMEPAKHNNR